MKVDVLEADKQFITDMNQLIREKHITGVMATSLMNDHSYTNNIANKLIEIGTILFKSQNTTLHEIEKSLMLDEKETVEAIAARKASEQGSLNHED